MQSGKAQSRTRPMKSPKKEDSNLELPRWVHRIGGHERPSNGQPVTKQYLGSIAQSSSMEQFDWIFSKYSNERALLKRRSLMEDSFRWKPSWFPKESLLAKNWSARKRLVWAKQRSAGRALFGWIFPKNTKLNLNNLNNLRNKALDLSQIIFYYIRERISK